MNNAVEHRLFTLMVVHTLTASAQNSQEKILLHVASPQKGQNSKFEVRYLLNVYHCCTIVKSKKALSQTVVKSIFVVLLCVSLFICLYIYLMQESSISYILQLKPAFVD